MGWTRQPGRVVRGRRRPCLESLETRQLLSHVAARPASSGTMNSDGSTNYDQIIGASAVRSEFDVDGTGQTVAVIDTGADFNNPALGGAVGAGDKIVAGVDFTGSPNGIQPTWQHGTGVAGLVAGNGGGYTGVAPGADIVALRVFGDNNQGSFNAIADALEWVVQNHSEYNITAVNLSVSDGGNYTSNIFANTGVGQQITSDIGQLDTLDIPVVIAAGNSFDGKTQGLGFPAVVSDAISVTATDANDKLASTAQRLGPGQGSSAVTIAAPGVGITAPSGDSGTSTEDGTSFATPQVTGSIVLLQEMYENAYHTLPTVSQLETLLQQGAVTVHDPATGLDVGRLDVLNSAKILNQQITSQNNSNSGASTTTTTAGSGGGSTTTPTTSTGPGSGGSTTTSTGSGGSSTTPTTTNGSGGSTTTTTSTSTSDLSQTTTPPASTTTTTGPLTQVFVNGVSIGDYSTSQLAAKYPGLFSFLNGPVPSINIWAPAGSTVDLGPAPASVGHTKAAKPTNPAPAASTTVKNTTAEVKLGAEQAKAVKLTKAVPVAHKVAPKKSNPISSFFSSLFHF